MNYSKHKSQCPSTCVAFLVPNPGTDRERRSPFSRLKNEITELALGLCPGVCLCKAACSLVCSEPELGDTAQGNIDPQGRGRGAGRWCCVGERSRVRRRAARRRNFIFLIVEFRE